MNRISIGRSALTTGIATGIVAISFYFLPLAVSSGKELPRLVDITDLKSDPDGYDRHRVTVIGTVSSCEKKTGRRGSRYIEIEVVQNGSSILAVSDTVRCAKAGAEVVVQGTYRRSGWFAGYLFHEYMNAEHVVYGY
ncbi:MAG: hypothetical protein WAO55_01215 [Candidatus Manganitrophaceae bacterium]